VSLKRKDALARQKADFEQKLKDRLDFLSGKGIDAGKIEKDTIVRKLKADVRAVNARLKAIADGEKLTQDLAKAKAAKAAAKLKEKEGEKAEKGAKPEKAEKPKKGGGTGQEKKAKPEKKAAPKAAESD